MKWYLVETVKDVHVTNTIGTASSVQAAQETTNEYLEPRTLQKIILTHKKMRLREFK